MGTRMVVGTFKKTIAKPLLSLCIAIFLLTNLVAITFYSLIANFEWLGLLNIIKDDYSRYVITFTLWQAILSTILSVGLAIPIARSLHRRSNFFGRKLLLNFLNLSFALPAITLVLGIIIMHGKNGWINHFIHKIFDSSFDYYLYGIFGVMLGHLAFCLPLAVRMLLSCLDSIPQETWRLTNQLDFSSSDIFKVVEWPYLRPSTISLSILIFMMCFSSFTIVLALGGGPSVTTIEVAIYQALRMDFDLSHATNLALIQFAICTLLMIILHKYNTPLFYSLSSNLKIFKRPDVGKFSVTILDIFFIVILLILSILPVIAVLTSGFNSKFFTILYSQELWESGKQSFLIAICSGILTMAISLSLVSGAFYLHYMLDKSKLTKYIILISNIRLMIPTFVFSAGLFIALNGVIPIEHISFYLIVIMNSIAALPFAVGIILPPSLRFSLQEIYLCKHLNITGWDFIKLIYWPKLRKPISYALALVVTISWGDLGVTALFNSNNFTTLPYLLYNLMSNYYIEESAVVALIILLSSFLLFWIIEGLLGGEENVKA